VYLILHFEESLILSFENENVGDASERDSKMDDFGLGDVGRDVADVDHLRRRVRALLGVQTNPLGLIIVTYSFQ
jgi:hypothetical protein